MNNISRREFIKVLSSAGTGLLVGFYIPSKNRLLGDAEYNSLNNFMPNGWVNITSDGRTIIYVSKSEMGQGVWTALPMIVADEMDLDWENVEIAQAETNPELYDSQGTGGSYAIRGSWKPLREAAARSKEMLIQAAINEWNVNRDECFTDKGFVIHRSSQKKLSYGNLTEAASKLDFPDTVPLKDPKDYTLIGTNISRKDTPLKINGSALFGIDKYLDGMVYSMVEMPPAYGCSVEEIDTKKSRTISGFIDAFLITNGVAVIGESTWAVDQARKKLVVKWSQGSRSDLNSQKIYSMFKDQAKKKGKIGKEYGNVKKALSKANEVISSEYLVPFQAHATMEPMNCVIDLKPNYCEVWQSTQDPQEVKEIVADFTGISPKNIRVHVPFLGGGFGRRLFNDYLEDTLEIAKKINKPVKLIWKREDDMKHDFYRPASNHFMSGCLDRYGRIQAWSHKVVAPSISHSDQPNTKRILDEGALHGASNLIYGIPNFSSEFKLANTEVPIGYWRSVYNSQNAFANESFMDELAYAAKKDPLEFRLEYLKDSPKNISVLRSVAKNAGWGEKLEKGHYHGIACHESFGSSVAQVAEISVGTNGKVIVHKVSCAIHCGQIINPSIVEAQMESSIVYGLSAALKGEITISDGHVVQSNFDDFDVLRMDEMPEVDVQIVKSKDDPGGVGEPGLPPIAPAVANAVFAATGVRVRRLPIKSKDLIN